jgi:hypothetical protein
MEDYKKLFLEEIDKTIEETLTSGVIENPNQQYSFVEAQITRLLPLNIPKVAEIFKQYKQDQKEITEKLQKIEKEMQKLMDEYTSNVQELQKLPKKLLD